MNPSKLKIKKTPVSWFVYVLLCEDKSLYTGISPDPHKRFEDHKKGKGGAYTRSHKPIKIVYTERVLTKSDALKRELEIKKLSRKEKIVKLGLIPKDIIVTTGGYFHAYRKNLVS